MNQTKLESFIEQCLNTASGFIISLIVWTAIIVPVWDLQVNMIQNINITLIFTILSIVRGYVWRRFFNAGVHNLVKKWVSTYAMSYRR
jgi:hypothetical protein